MLRALITLVTALSLTACSVFGGSGVETPAYQVVQSENDIEIRRYERLVLAITPLPDGMAGDRDAAFRRLFNYIAGENRSNREIDMTAPVLMGEPGIGESIDMTAPVLIDEGGEPTMAFVLPASYTLDTAPRPTDPSVHLKQLENWTVAAIRFSGSLSTSNARTHRERLTRWLAVSAWRAIGPSVVAGYNPPWTLPMFRRNEVLVPVERR